MNSPSPKVTPDHLQRLAYLYVRQSSLQQVQDHRESTARQYDLKRRAQTLGWSSEQIVVIDEDLGLSGASSAARSGFQRLVADVGLGRVGVVMGLEVSRLARNSSDWHRLLEICALAETLILDEDGVYDPSHFNDRLLLGLKGTMSEAELHVLRARLIGGQLNKAARGELWIRPPLGFVIDREGKLSLDPDTQIQAAVRLLFETFKRTGSAFQVVRHFQGAGIQWPRRISFGPRAGEVVFTVLEHSRVTSILHNPRYAGAFVYGRTRQRKVPVPGRPRFRKLPRQEWKVVIPNSHPGYVTWEEYEANQATLRANANSYGTDRCRTPAREGAALLQGLVICGRCGRRMSVRYSVVAGRPVPTYTCMRDGIQTATPVCQVVPGSGLDDAVARLVLKAVTPAALDVALQVFDDLRARQADVDRLRRIQIDRLREDAELAQRQFMLVRPENRLVADSLERQWNGKLVMLREAEDAFGKTHGSSRAVSAQDQEMIRTLVADLPRVWNDPRTPLRDRKRMLRLVIEDVTLRREDKIHVDIRWRGGATSSMDVPLPLSAPDLRRTPPATVEQVRALAAEQTDGQIACTLNGRFLKTGTGKPFSRLAVRRVREAYGIAGLFDRLRSAGWLSVQEMATLLGVHYTTAKRFAAEGVLVAKRADDKSGILFAPPTGPLPRAHPGKRFRDRRRYERCPPQMKDEVQYEA